MDLVKAVYYLGRWALSVWYAERMETVIHRVTRYRARSATRRFKGPITLGMLKLCNLGEFLWRRTVEWSPAPSMEPDDSGKGKPCGCGED